jgi:hypothetical protein
MQTKLNRKVRLFQAKVKLGLAQAVITKRRLELLETLKPLIRHPDDKKVIEIALRGKNITPRYW